MRIELFDVVGPDPTGKFEVRMAAWPNPDKSAALVNMVVFWMPGQEDAGWLIRHFSQVRLNQMQQVECRDFAAAELHWLEHVPNRVHYVRL